MRTFALFLASLFALAAASADADVYVKPHVRKDGTYVQGHYRSNPDGIFSNNWSTVGNVNPYTDKAGWIKSPPTGYGMRSYPGSGTKPSRPNKAIPSGNAVDAPLLVKQDDQFLGGFGNVPIGIEPQRGVRERVAAPERIRPVVERRIGVPPSDEQRQQWDQMIARRRSDEDFSAWRKGMEASYRR